MVCLDETHTCTNVPKGSLGLYVPVEDAAVTRKSNIGLHFAIVALHGAKLRLETSIGTRIFANSTRRDGNELSS